MWSNWVLQQAPRLSLKIRVFVSKKTHRKPYKNYLFCFLEQE